MRLGVLEDCADGWLLSLLQCSHLNGCTGTRQEADVGNAAQLAPAIATLRAAYAAFNRGDIDAAVEGLDAQIEWTEPVEFPGGGTYHGRDSVKHATAK